MSLTQILIVVLEIAIFVPCLVLHEVSHGWVARWLGDTTAHDRGRLSLNPLRHIDPFGTVLLPLLLLIASHGQYAFGYAKPVPIDPRRMTKTTYQTGLLLTGIAGPITNALLALAGTVVYWVIAFKWGNGVPDFVVIAVTFFILINLVLLFFNLLPIPPFDGSRVFQWFLKGEALRWYYQAERYGFYVIFIAIFVLPLLTNGAIDPVGAYLSVTVFPIVRILAPASRVLFGI
jgi:Zn-dependent protease